MTSSSERGLGYGIGYAYAQDNLCLLANEVLDVMPVQLVVWRAGEIFERGVTLDAAGDFAWQDRPAEGRLRAAAEALPDTGLTPRMQEIRALLRQGLSNKHIAQQLDLSEGTVKNYVSTILDKLDTRDRTRAVLKAITLRVI